MTQEQGQLAHMNSSLPTSHHQCPETNNKWMINARMSDQSKALHDHTAAPTFYRFSYPAAAVNRI